MPARPRRTIAQSSSITPTADRPERLVQAAHELLVERGLSGIKVLDVAARAGANVALINYHFGGRDGLLDEVVRRVAAQIAQARSARLAELLALSGSELPSAAEVLRCWIEPWLKNLEHDNNREVMMLMLHLMFAADVEFSRKERLLESSIEVTSRFVDVLSRIFPAITREQMTWRMLCAIGASYLVLGQARPVGWDVLSGGRTQPRKAVRQQAMNELVSFILAGLSAPNIRAVANDTAPRQRSARRDSK